MEIQSGISPSREDYLKIIFELGGDTKKVSNKQILAELSVSAASVSEMITKLVEEEFVTHTPYQGIQLTPKGTKAAALLVRNHRLWEVFLVDKLDYTFATVHPEAEVLEHVTTQELANRLSSFLGTPKRCPHGGVIPDRSGHFDRQSHRDLASLKIGESARIDRILDNRELLDYINEIGLSVNDHVKLTKIGLFESPLTLFDETNQKQMQIGVKAAQHIFIETVK